MVRVRSYSRISGRMSEDSETGTPGSSAAASSRMRRSWAGLAKELTSDTVRASTWRRRSSARAARTLSSSSGRSTSPRAPTRSATSTVCSRAASGSGLGQMIQPARPPGTNDRATWRTCR